MPRSEKYMRAFEHTVRKTNRANPQRRNDLYFAASTMLPMKADKRMVKLVRNMKTAMGGHMG